MSDPYAWGAYSHSTDPASYYGYSYQQQQSYSQQDQQQQQSWNYGGQQQQNQQWQQHHYDPQAWQQQHQQEDPRQHTWSQQQQGSGWPYPSSYYNMHQQTQHRQNQAAQAAASMTAALQGPPKTGSHSTVYPSQHSQHSQHPQQPEHLQHPQYTQTYNHQGYPPTPPSATDASWDQVKALSCCFRTYRTLKDKEKHMQQHVRCPQCPYSAAKVLVDDHLRVEHNVADKSSKSKPDGIVPFNAPKLDTPEALNAWIQARKKNWPTKANVERKEQEKRKRQLERSDRPKQEPKEKKQKTAEDIRAIVGDYGSSSECEEEEGSKVPSSTRSDEEEDDIMDPERDAVTSKDPKAMGRVGSPPPTRPRKLCKYFMTKRGCLHGDKCTFSHERPSRPEPRQKKPPMTKSRPNLLRKLLEKEIEQERNVLLQCFRHIVDNDFFQ